MKGTRAIIIFTVSVCVLVGRVSADFLQESITVSAVVPYNMSTGYTTEQPSPYIPLTTGVPLTVIAGTDTVILKGVAYPDSIITLLKNGVVSDSFPANLRIVASHNARAPVNTFLSGFGQLLQWRHFSHCFLCV